MDNQEATAEAIRAIVQLKVGQLSTVTQVRLWHFDHIDSEDNMDRMAMLLFQYHDNDSADPNALKINDCSYRVETIYSGQDDAGNVVIVPFKKGDVVRSRPPVHRIIIPRRELDTIKTMWLDGLKKLGIPLVYPDYSQKAKESFGINQGDDWPRTSTRAIEDR